MERCPNCGATVRAGAKFCTTCGMRLPETPVAEPPTSSLTSSRSPFESTSSVATSRWPAERPTQVAASGASSGYAVGSGGAQEEKVQDEPETEPTAVPEPASAPATATETGENAEPSGAPAWPPLGRTSSWDSSWRSSSASANDEAAGDSAAPETPPDVIVPQEVEPEESPVTGTETGQEVPADAGLVEAEEPESLIAEEAEQVDAASDVVADTSTEPEAEPEVAADLEPEQQVAPAAIEETPATEVEPEIEAPEQQPGPSDLMAIPPSGGGLDRAYALIDELRAAIAGLSGGRAQEEVDAATIADGLAAARSGASDEEFERLRTALASARERPRDIDTMLDVSGRLEAIAALDDAYQRLASAVDDAIEALRPSSNEANADE